MLVKLNEKLAVFVDIDQSLALDKQPKEIIKALDVEDWDKTLPDLVEIEVPSQIKICGACSGEGKSSAYLGAFSGRRLEEARADTEFWEDYMNGQYDRICETCDGSGRVRVPIDQLPEFIAKAIQDADDADAESAAERRAEYMMSGGWREEGYYDH